MSLNISGLEAESLLRKMILILDSKLKNQISEMGRILILGSEHMDLALIIEAKETQLDF